MAIFLSFGERSFTSLPSIEIFPDVILSSPAIIRSKVDFPHPEGPTKVVKDSLLIFSEKFLMTWVLPKDLLRFSIEISASIEGILKSLFDYRSWYLKEKLRL